MKIKDIIIEEVGSAIDSWDGFGFIITYNGDRYTIMSKSSNGELTHVDVQGRRVIAIIYEE